MLYNLSKRSDCVEQLRASMIIRNIMQVVDDFPRDFDILRPALRAISNLLSKELILQIDVAELLNVACRVLNQYAGRKTFVLEVMDLISNLAKNLTSYTAIRVRDILDPMIAVMKRFKDNEEIIVKTLVVIEMMVPADVDGKQLKEARVQKVVMDVSDNYLKSAAVQAGVFRVWGALLRISYFFHWMVQHMSRLMETMQSFPQSKEVQTVCVDVLTKLCEDQGRAGQHGRVSAEGAGRAGGAIPVGAGADSGGGAVHPVSAVAAGSVQRVHSDGRRVARPDGHQGVQGR